GVAGGVAHWAAGLLFQSLDVDETDCGRGGDDLDGPAFLLGHADENSDVGGGAGGAHHDVEGFGLLGHAAIPARSASSVMLARRWPVERAWMSVMSWWTAGRVLSSSGANRSAVISAS